MNGRQQKKTFRRPRRDAICGATAYRSRFSRVHGPFWPRCPLADRHSAPVKREEQRNACGLPEVPGDTRLDFQRHRHQGASGVGGKRPCGGDPKGHEAKPQCVVRRYLDIVGLGSGDGYSKIRIRAQRVCQGRAHIPCSKNAALTPSGGVDVEVIAPSDGVEGCRATPSDGAIRSILPMVTAPSDGAYIDVAISGRKFRPAAAGPELFRALRWGRG